ncbi:DUF2147 domain-containing protein [Polycladidibacter stylochi]|uniref:DUF2147 domain-containing protein n=1 Tax=Polycladidibacter stylochi TaxID=1807766 RepID=UPI00082CC4B0|nr:DUF2147 domain-containing protein [Pseudovibrio stylochi]
MIRFLNASIKRLSIALSLFLLSYLHSFAGDPTGVWLRASGTSKIKITKCGEAYCGHLAWVKDPRNDIHNPDKSKRNRPLRGIQTVIDMKPDGENSWSGSLYNALDGKTYKGKMKLLSANKLSLKGCVLGGLICKGENWTRTQ